MNRNYKALIASVYWTAQIALRSLEVGDLEERINALEQAVNARQRVDEISVFEIESSSMEPYEKEIE